MASEVIMPKMGDAMDSGVIVQWLKNVGDKVVPDDAIAEIETDKSNVEITADSAGFIQQITGKPGETIPVGQVIAIIGTVAPTVNGAGTAPAAGLSGTSGNEEKDVPLKSATIAPVTSPSPASANGVSIALTPVKVKQTGEFKPYNSYVGALPKNLGGSASVIGEPIEIETVPGATEPVKATPVARAMAQAHNLDLSNLKGSGPDGAVGKRDVEAALAGGANGISAPVTAAPSAAPAKAAPAVTTVTATEGDDTQEFSAMRRTIAKRLTESKSTIPHFYVNAEIDMEELITLREQINASAGGDIPKVSINDCLIKAVAAAIAENPRVNAAYCDNKRILRKGIHIGFGVALDDGLIVPVVREADKKSLRTVARETKPLIDKARTGKLAPADYTGGTFTISNLGVLPGITEFSAIINPGEGAILAVASTLEVPAVVGGQVVPRKRMKVTLSGDHRVMDGADGAKFLVSLKRIIENPMEMLV
jgi:pyruvate dehydrogenase E2 component (dihydrolipoamide acetyltransferase)